MIRATSRKRRRAPVRLIAIVLSVAAVLTAGGILLFGGKPFDPSVPTLAPVSDTSSNAGGETSGSVTLDILAVGDILGHETVLNAGKTSDGYDFEPMYEYVKPRLEKADLALCNFEGTMAGPPYTGYPVFSAPDAFGAALQKAGFHVAGFMNNHTYDKGTVGVDKTLERLRSAGLLPLGITDQHNQRRYEIREVSGVKIGLMAITFEIGSSSGVSLNGIPVPSQTAARMNLYNANNIDRDFEKLRPVIEEMVAGSNLSIMLMHWGTEYRTSADAGQKKIAGLLNGMGVDVIFGAHSHTVQPYEKITASGSTTHVYYSLGNFLSNQRQEILNEIGTEDGVIAEITVQYTPGENKANVIKAGYTATWTYRSEDTTIFKIIPVEQALNNAAQFGVRSDIDLKKLADSQKNTDKALSALNP